MTREETELVTVRAADDAALVDEIARVVDFIDRVPDVSLVDVAYTCSLTSGEAAIALVVSSVQDLRDRLSSAKSRIALATTKRLKDKSGTYYFRERLLGKGRGKLAFIFPGVMSFYPDMLRDLVIAYPECRTPFDELEEALANDPSFTPSNFIFPPAPHYQHDADIFSSGAYAQALVSTFAASEALAKLLSSLGLRPDGVVGLAGGDLASAVCSGTTGADTARPNRVAVIRDIYRMVDKAVDHAGLPETVMAMAILRRPEDLDELRSALPPEKVVQAVDFSPRMKLFAIDPDFEEEATRLFANAGVRLRKIELNRPFNTPKCKSIVPAIKKFTVGAMKSEATCEVYSCAIAEALANKHRTLRNDVAERWARPIRFSETIARMHDDGYRVFLEVGPRGLLTSCVDDILKGREFAAIATNSIHRRGVLQFQHAIAQLVALGAAVDVSGLYTERHPKKLDFANPHFLEVRKYAEMPLSRTFPKLTLLWGEGMIPGASTFGEPKGRGAKAAVRAAVIAAQARRQRQFDYGAMSPMVSDADTVESTPGVSCELVKEFRFADAPFIADFAYGSSQLSYSDPNLRGLVLLQIPVGAEIMAETAQRVMPNRVVAAIEDFTCRRRVAFRRGSLKLFVKAERTAGSDPSKTVVKVQLRDDSPDSAYTWPVMEANFLMAERTADPVPASVEPIGKPRSVHWSGREIYPSKLGFGRRLRGISFAETWGEGGLDYDVTVPPLAGNIAATAFPVWTVNPLLMQIVVSGFMLWRSHEKFPGAFSFPYNLRRMAIYGELPKEGSTLKCYLRLTGVTPKSHLCDITVTDGNGTVLMELDGWEELTERVPQEYCDLVLQPATSFVTAPVSRATMGEPQTEVGTAYITDIPYGVFERNEGLWLRIMSHVVLNAPERKDFGAMTGSVSRKTEWLFGRIAVKEAVRRYLKDFHQARWSDADVQIWRDENGKPHALGAWGDGLTVKLDVAIAHTAQFVIALAAANYRVGVDVESVARNLSEEFAQGVFSPEELAVAAKASNPAQIIIRFWCAKEAVSKALGTGIRFPPKELVVTGYDGETGRITCRLEGGWVEAFKIFKGRDIAVASKVLRDHALAFCFLPSALFE